MGRLGRCKYAFIEGIKQGKGVGTFDPSFYTHAIMCDNLVVLSLDNDNTIHSITIHSISFCFYIVNGALAMDEQILIPAQPVLY